VTLPQPLTAELDGSAVGEDAALRAPADPRPGLEHHHLVAERDQPPRSGETCQTGSDDDDLHDRSTSRVPAGSAARVLQRAH
jgi:hypothetical protein